MQHLRTTLAILFLPVIYGQTPSDLANTSWRLVKFQPGNDAPLTPADPSKYTLAFDDKGNVSIRIDCNQGRGTWKSTGQNQIEFSPLALTRAACPSADLNTQIPKQWANIHSYALKSGHLFLSLMGDGGTYEFEPEKKAEAPALENTDWKLVRLGDMPITVAKAERQPRLMLTSSTHRASGSGGCNTFSGAYEINNGNRIAFTKMISTMMACVDGMETESAFLKALEHAKTWRIDRTQLDLLDADGNSLAAFSATL
jgi:heat shock protein HslJ